MDELFSLASLISLRCAHPPTSPTEHGYVPSTPRVLWVCPLCSAYAVIRTQGHLMLLCGIAFIPRTGTGQKDSSAGSDCVRSRGHISISCVSLVCVSGAGAPFPFCPNHSSLQWDYALAFHVLVFSISHVLFSPDKFRRAERNVLWK